VEAAVLELVQALFREGHDRLFLQLVTA
jgi:hypothetical protein